MFDGHEVIRALSAGQHAEEHIQRAKDAIEDMRQIRLAEGGDEEDIDDELRPLNDMVRAVEDDLVDVESEAAEEAEEERTEGAEVVAAEVAGPAGAGVKRKRTREVTPIVLLPTPPDIGHHRKQPMRRMKSKQSEESQ